MLKTVQIWARMLQQVGLDLCDSGVKESQIWKSVWIEEFSRLHQANYGARVGQLIYGPTPADWSLMIHWPISMPIFKLHPPPGAFPGNCDLPTTIIWYPTEEERNEGPWEIAEGRTIQSNRHSDLRAVVAESKEPFEELVDGVQDDLGPIMLMHHRASRPQGSASRSFSQLRSMDRKEVPYSKMREFRHRNWLGTYHLCPFDSQWRLGFFARDEIGPYRFYHGPRGCAKGISNERHSVQESWLWRRHSYLGHIAICQDSDKKYSWTWYGTPKSMRHTATRSCPQSCSKVHLDRIQMPEELRSFHPKRIYEEDLEIEADEET
jgi:hypothetical protein